MEEDKYNVAELEEAELVKYIAIEKMRFFDKNKIGKLVKVRPCDKKYEDKTFLGIHIGNLPIPMFVRYIKGEQKISVSNYYNPAIFIPDINEVVFGYESWWTLIKSADEVKDITDEDIENTWYVKMIKDLG